MANSNLVRLGGLAAMAGSVAHAMANLALWLSEPPTSELIRRLDRYRTIQTLDDIFFVSLVLGAWPMVPPYAVRRIRERSIHPSAWKEATIGWPLPW